jgi:putative addiction module killer protein
VLELRRTKEFERWLADLGDRAAASRIAARLVRVQSGLFGDAKSVGDGVSELRVDYGPGYRIYFTRRGTTIIFLLSGGDKQSQRRDIEKAKALAKAIGAGDVH